MVMLRIGDNTVNWTAPGLPTTTFRIMLAHGVAEYVPAPINAANRQRRQDIVAMLSRSGSPLSVGLAALMQSTAAAGGIEFSAYLLRDDPTSLRVGPSGRGTTTHAPQGAPPPGAIGFVQYPSGVGNAAGTALGQRFRDAVSAVSLPVRGRDLWSRLAALRRPLFVAARSIALAAAVRRLDRPIDVIGLRRGQQ